MSLSMALVDFIPVALFFVASLILMRDLYHMMSKGAFALMSGGFIIIFVAGLFKATWKILYVLEICDYQALNNAFFPMQSTGFVLAALGLLALVINPQQNKLMAVVVPFTSSMPLVVLLIIGTAGLSSALAIISAKMKKVLPTILFVVYFIIMLGMGYLSSRDFTEPLWNWVGEGMNILGQLSFLAAVLMLDKSGLFTFELAKSKNN